MDAPRLATPQLQRKNVRVSDPALLHFTLLKPICVSLMQIVTSDRIGGPIQQNGKSHCRTENTSQMASQEWYGVHLKSCMLEVSCLPVSRLSLPSP